MASRPNLQPPPDIATGVEDAITKALERDSWPRNGKLYVSDLKHALPPEEGGDCKRKLKAKLENEPTDDMDLGVRMMLHWGDLIHEEITDWLEEHMEGWTVVGVEERAREVEPLRGRLDIMLAKDDSEITCIIDVKTKRGGSFRYLEEPKKADVLQVQSYLMAKDADHGLLVYVDREGQNFIRAFPVERNDGAVRRARDELVRIRDAPSVRSVEALDPVLKRRDNKGPDSIKVEWPWQVEWCPLKTCHCRSRVSSSLPRGIVGYVNNDGTLDMKDKYKGTDIEAWVRKKLEEGK